MARWGATNDRQYCGRQPRMAGAASTEQRTVRWRRSRRGESGGTADLFDWKIDPVESSTTLNASKAEVTRALETDPSDKSSHALAAMIEDVLVGKTPRLTEDR